jgi:hypothetical protein
MDAGAAGGSGVEIAEADIVGVSDTSALFISKQHGLLMTDLSGDQATFRCAAKLPGEVDQFYLHGDRLVVIVQDAARQTGHLLHFSVANDELAFVEVVDLGRSRVLDSRRFNDRLVIYTDLRLEDDDSPAYGDYYDYYYPPPNQNRVLRVYDWGDRLTEELTETHIDDSPTEEYLSRADLDRNTPAGTVLAQSSRMSHDMWASDHYFVVTEEQTDTVLRGWETRHYSVCVEGHSEPYSYRSCTTQYETRPNPAYVPPDNSGGDRSCSGTTLESCIRKVASESAETIQVPVGTTCQMVESSRYVCDRSEYQSYTYPVYEYETYSRLHIYEYTDAGFIRFSDEVTDVDAANLATTDLDATIDTLALAEEAAELKVSGSVQAVQFQNGYLYVISEGRLQTYALASNSLLRTADLQVAGDRIQTTRFTPDKLYLSDGDYWSGSGENSVLRVIDLANAAFPVQSSQDRRLPGSHQLILPTLSGILTTGFVNQFEGNAVNLIKVGLFEDPSTVELSYLFLGTDLDYPHSGQNEASYFDGQVERLFWPYSGNDLETGVWRNRVGVSHIAGTEIVSEGAVDLPQLPERIRPRLTTAEVLTFADSSLNSLSQQGAEWAATPVFEYFTPVAVYRLNDDEDYVEVLNLGNRCKLHFSRVDALNDRTEESTTEAFLCTGSNLVAYEQNLLWNDQLGVRFELDGTFEQLSADVAADLWEKAQTRDVCLFSEEVATSTGSNTVDPLDPPPFDTLFCVTHEEYQTLRDAAYEQAGN